MPPAPCRSLTPTPTASLTPTTWTTTATVSSRLPHCWQLHNMRHNLAGTSYDDEKADTGTGHDTGDSTGCPPVVSSVGGCIGYELTTDLDFDTDDDGTWSTISSLYTLDADDDNDAYFDVDTGGWLPIGSCTGSCTDRQ